MIVVVAVMDDIGAVFDDLVRFETELYNAVDARLRAAHDVSLGTFEVLRVIARLERCRVQNVAGALSITVGAASKAVDRVEAAGLCRRVANPDDRRSSLVAPTAAGRRLLARAEVTFTAELHRHFAGVPARDVTQLHRTLRALRANERKSP